MDPFSCVFGVQKKARHLHHPFRTSVLLRRGSPSSWAYVSLCSDSSEDLLGFGFDDHIVTRILPLSLFANYKLKAHPRPHQSQSHQKRRDHGPGSLNPWIP